MNDVKKKPICSLTFAELNKLKLLGYAIAKYDNKIIIVKKG